MLPMQWVKTARFLFTVFRRVARLKLRLKTRGRASKKSIYTGSLNLTFRLKNRALSLASGSASQYRKILWSSITAPSKQKIQKAAALFLRWHFQLGKIIKL